MGTYERGAFEISTDLSRLDLDRVESFLRQSYWAAQRPREVIERSVRNSLCLGLYRQADGEQLGFARVVTDYATFGWVCDVFIDASVRGQGLGKWLIETLVNLPELAGVRLVLGTRDAHGLYEKFGFQVMEMDGRWMNRAAEPESRT